MNIKKTILKYKNALLAMLLFGLIGTHAYASKPLWIFTPNTATEITVVKGNSAQVVYTVQNQSLQAKSLIIKPITGINQSAPCKLPAKGSCTLTLNIIGSGLTGDVIGGPILCQEGNDLQCYQPSSNHALRVHLAEQPPIPQFTITPSASPNGVISPAAPQVVNIGSNLTFTATPAAGFAVVQWLLDGNVVQTGGTSYQLSNIQANHTIAVIFGKAILSPLTQNLLLSINSSLPGAPVSDPALVGNARIIRIQNTGSLPASNLSISSGTLPNGTSITAETCTGTTLNPGATCDITLTPGANASLDAGNNACTTVGSTAPIPTTITVGADNASSININVLVLGYGCLYQGGLIFSIDDITPNTGSIAGKIAALADEEQSPGVSTFPWSTVHGVTGATSFTDGLSNTMNLITPPGQYPAAQACSNQAGNWYLPSICELGGRYVGSGSDPGCGTTNANLYNTLSQQGYSVFDTVIGYASSTEQSANEAWYQFFPAVGSQNYYDKFSNAHVRCIRLITN
ncbi:InlB B-repeat-containing protein [Legionella saoudiensis]|uniref:InlB B-repeat-containing protein n=1 Tax=Legionella saoudiensis TaxID=1750561 RepID=UPI00072FC8FF|nr:hypothetical protein [Legionella saoudiensis]